MSDSVLDCKSFTVTTYLPEKERSIWLIRLLLKSICLWPCSSSATIVERVLSEFSICTCFSLLLITTVSAGLAIFVEERGNIDLMMVHIGPFFCYIMTVIKYICLVLHVNNIRTCVDYIELDWNIVKSIEDHKVMLRHAKSGRLIATLLTIFMHSAVQFYSVTRCLIKHVVEMDNVNISFHELPYPFYREILDVHFSPAYEVVLVVQSISAFIMCGITSANCGLMAIFVMHACGQLKILTLWLNNIVHDDDVVDISTVHQKVGFIVEHHLRVINFVSHIEEVIYLTCLVELVGGSLTLCLLGYCSITAWNHDKKDSIPTYFIAGISFTLNIFIICYIAEILSEEYRRVGMATYMTKWYRLPPKSALSLLLINLRCNLNVNLSAGKMIELSLYTFGNVLKASVTYLNMLRQVTT